MIGGRPTAGLLYAAILCLGVSRAIAGTAAAAEPTQARLSYWSAKTIPEGKDPRGKTLFHRFCTECHGPAPAGPAPGTSKDAPARTVGPRPPGPPGTAELQAKYHGTLPAQLEKRTDLNFAWVRWIIRHGYYVMAPIRKTELSDADVDAIAAYLTKDKQGTR